MRPNQKPFLLPSYASAFERALASLEPDLAALGQATRELATIFDPARLPEKLLPFLAWDFSVDSWSPHWDEATRRKVIAASWIVHRYKGTRPAILAATEALGYQIEIIEWFDVKPEGVPGTFTLIASGDPVALWNSEAISDLRRAVDGSRALSRHWSLQVKIKANINIRLGASGAGLASAEACGGYSPSGELRMGIGAAGLGQIIVEARVA